MRKSPVQVLAQSPQARPLPAFTTRAGAFGALALGCWMLLHLYWGVVHDGVLYTMQALAHLRPDLYAVDIYLKYGSQDRFSIFGPLYALLAVLEQPYSAQSIFHVIENLACPPTRGHTAISYPTRPVAISQASRPASGAHGQTGGQPDRSRWDGSFVGFVPAEGGLGPHGFFRLLSPNIYRDTKDHGHAFTRRDLLRRFSSRFRIVKLAYSYHLLGATLDAAFFASFKMPMLGGKLEAFWRGTGE